MTAVADPQDASTPPLQRLSQPRVLVVGTDLPDIDSLAGELMRRDLHVMLGEDAAAGLRAIDATHPDVVVLTPSLPTANASSFLREVRRRHVVPVIVGVDAEAASASVALLLAAGATACVAWPFRLAEVLPILRGAGTADPCPDVLRGGGVEVRVPAHEVRVDGRRVHLPLREFELLVLLMLNAGTVVTRQQIKDALWGVGDTVAENTVTAHVARLRQRLGDDREHPVYIDVVRRVGYRFSAREEAWPNRGRAHRLT